MLQCPICGNWYDNLTGHRCPWVNPGYSYPQQNYYPFYFIDNVALNRIAAALEKIAGIGEAKSDKPKEVKDAQ